MSLSENWEGCCDWRFWPCSSPVADPRGVCSLVSPGQAAGRISVFGLAKVARRESEAVGFETISSLEGMGHFKRIHQPSTSGFLAPPAKRGERIMERGTRKQTSRSTNHLTSQKLSATPPRPSPSIRIDGEGGKTTGFAEVFEIGNAGEDSLKNRDAP